MSPARLLALPVAMYRVAATLPIAAAKSTSGGHVGRRSQLAMDPRKCRRYSLAEAPDRECAISAPQAA